MKPVSEWSSYYSNIENKTVSDVLLGINREDEKVAAVIRAAIPEIEPLIQAVLPRLKKGGRLFYLGSGTSGRLGIVDASECPPTFGVSPGLIVGIIAGGDTAIRTAVEHAEDDQEQGWKDLLLHEVSALDSVIGIAASGKTPYVVGALKKAQLHGLITGCITVNPDTELVNASEFPIILPVGPEFITGSSRMKAGTAQKLVLNMISTTLMIKLGRIKGNKMVDMQLTNNKLIDRGTRMVMEDLDIDFEEASRLLLKFGSVRKAIESAR